MKFKLLLIAVFLVFAAAAQGQIIEKIDPVAYENHQRAIRLKAYRHEIQTLENSLIKCYQREIIAKFIIDKKLVEEYPAAEGFIIDCLEDTVNQKDHFPYSMGSHIKNIMHSLLRKMSAEKANALRKKFPVEDDLISNSIDDLETESDIENYANQKVAEILSGKISDTLFFIIPRINQRSPQQAIRILSALLTYFERNQLSNSNWLLIKQLANNLLETSSDPELTIRMLRLAVRFAQLQVPNLTTDVEVATATDVLRRSLPLIQTMLPEEYPNALSIYTILNSRRSREEQKKDEAYDRINSSNDKLRQIITEAESTEDKEFERELWFMAAREAVKQNDFKVAVNCYINYGGKDANVPTAEVRDWEYFVLNDVLPAALKLNDIASADYALGKIMNVVERGGGHLKVFSRLIELKRNNEAFERLQTALNILNNADNNAHKIKTLLDAVPNAIILEEAAAFSIVREAVKAANRLPIPDPPKSDDRTAEYTYLLSTNVANTLNFAKAFTHISKLDVDLAYSLANQLDSNAWKMAAMLIVETERKFPVPEAEPKNSENN